MWSWKKKESDVIEVGWVGLVSMFPLSTMFPPEPFKYETNQKAPDFLRCPSVQDYLTNLYLIRTPLDFSVSLIEGDQVLIETDPPQFAQSIANNLLYDARIKGMHMVQMPMDIGFISDTPDVTLELVAIPLGRYVGHSFVVGRLNIYDWPARSLAMSFEWYDKNIPVRYKRGDAVFCIRLSHPSGKKIVLKQAAMTENIRKVLFDIDVIQRGFRHGTRAMIKNYSKLRRTKLLEWP